MSRDIAISSREISVQVVDNEVRVAYIGVPGPPGPPGENTVEWRNSWGQFLGEWNENTPYEAQSIVTYPKVSAGQPIGTYIARDDVSADKPPALHPDFWQVLASPGSQGGTSEKETVTAWLVPFRIRGNGEWNPNNTRYVGGPEAQSDIVLVEDDPDYGMSLYACIQTHNSSAARKPSGTGNAWWRRIVQGGKNGTNGASATIQDVTVSAIAPGSPASVDVTGPPSARSLAFRIPRGQDGDPGDDGKDALAWVAFEFDAEGSRSFVAPQAGVIKLGSTRVRGGGAGATYQVSKNGAPLSGSGDVSFAAGDEIKVTAVDNSEKFLITLVVGPAGS